MNANQPLQTGQTFARYQIVGIIGEGGMGTVYEAFHPVLKKRFAIKTLLADIAQTPEFRARFLREAEVAARINHPNIVRVTDVGSEGDTPYMVMEYLEGQTLGRLLAARGRLDISETMDILLPVVSAIATGHAEGVIHRDLKPDNIFLTQGPWGDIVPKVLDFGVSKLITEEPAGAITGTLTVIGTAAYMSPEQARGARQVDHLSDQYALGLILYEMLTGNRCRPGENAFEILYNIANLAIVPLHEARWDCPPELNSIVMRALSQEVENRFPSLLELGAALLPYASDKTRSAMGNAFPRPAVTAILPSGTVGDFAQAPARPPSTPSGPLPAGTKILPTGEEAPPVSAKRRPPSRRTVTDRVPRERPERGLVIGAATLGAVLLGAVVWVLLRNPSPTAPSTPTPPQKSAPSSEPIADERPNFVPPAARPVDIRTIPAEAKISIDDGAPESGEMHTTVPADGESHLLRVWAAGYEPKVVSLGPADKAPALIRLDPMAKPTAIHKRTSTENAHKPGRQKPAARPADPEPKAPRRGVNDAPILE
jgi:serine/threonine protein kinase